MFSKSGKEVISGKTQKKWCYLVRINRCETNYIQEEIT